MRISDWSSDVCSSDLVSRCAETARPGARIAAGGGKREPHFGKRRDGASVPAVAVCQWFGTATTSPPSLRNRCILARSRVTGTVSSGWARVAADAVAGLTIATPAAVAAATATVPTTRHTPLVPSFIEDPFVLRLEFGNSAQPRTDLLTELRE